MDVKRIVVLQLVVSVLVRCPVLGQVELKGGEDADLKAWAEVNSMSQSSLKSFLEKYSTGRLAQQAKVAVELQEMILQIENHKSEGAFIIPFSVLGEKWEAWQRTNPQKGAIGYYAKSISVVIDDNVQQDREYGCFSPEPFTGGKTLSINSLPPDELGLLACPTGDGSIIAFRTDGSAFPFTRTDLLIETSGDAPIYFAVIKRIGLVHLAGVGKVTLPDGRTLKLEGLSVSQ